MNSGSIENNSRHECFQVFCQKFGKEPEWLIRCPGRVNLIGEHIDYSHFSVLPMAIKDSTWVAVGSCAERKVHLYNVEPKYAPFCLEIADDSFSNASATEHTPLRWHHYFLAGWRGILTRLANGGGIGGNDDDNDAKALSQAKGMFAVVGSRIPPSAGLSSSSALVCAASLTTLCRQTGQIFEFISKKKLAEIATCSERFVGMEGGGMDQACECLAERGSALRIDFAPTLQWTHVKLPRNALFAVLHSGKECNKGAESHYNQRVVECRIAAQIIAKRVAAAAAESTENGKNNGKKPQHAWHEIRTLRHVAELLGLADQPAKMLPLVDKFLIKKNNVDEEKSFNSEMAAHSRDEICAILGCTNAELALHSLNTNTQNMQQFWLAKRAKHVFSEAARVLEFEQVCRNKEGRAALEEMAVLMNASHESCARLFECSCPELDLTVKKCLKAGCLGARLTGAGWGGCVVTLVDEADKSKVEANGLDVLFWSEPCDGIDATKLSSTPTLNH